MIVIQCIVPSMRLDKVFKKEGVFNFVAKITVSDKNALYLYLYLYLYWVTGCTLNLERYIQVRESAYVVLLAPQQRRLKLFYSVTGDRLVW